ncbi:MAG TPA: methionine--tRNA ligase [Vicinamibacteria bacterium]|nr:methionine--tRNA ligase [Vicinamibacteria bacterium]
MTKRTLFHTTPIYYVNDVPHAGHAYCTIASDALARARRLHGDEVFFLTGTDEHGQNIERIAKEKGVHEQDYCDQVSGVFKALWASLDIQYDGYIRTTDDLHKRGVLKLWEKLRVAKTPDGREAVYRGKYAGWYCPRCEAFKTDDEMKQPGNICPDHERPCEWTEEENFFFRLSAYQTVLEDLIRSDTMKIAPDSRKNEVLAVVKQGLQDFSISRARVKWGIPIPDDPSHVFYVWVDALSNYITALGYADDAPEYRKFWGRDAERMHIIGKEIIRFHCLYWPGLLIAAGLNPPSRVFAHGWMTKDGKKLSKSTGNIIDTKVLADQYGVDAVRYYFLRETSFGQDWDFSESGLAQRYNSDLANDFGNLVSRSLTMISKYCDGKIPATVEEGAELRVNTESVFASYEALNVSAALTEIWGYISDANQWIVQTAPWNVAKDPARAAELNAFLYRLAERVRVLALLASPVIPSSASKVLDMLGIPKDSPARASAAWGLLAPGQSLGSITPLFPRIELKKAPVNTETPPPAEAQGGTVIARPTSDVDGPKQPPPPTTDPAAAVPTPTEPELVGIEAFGALDLRSAKVVAAERIKGAKKLLKLQLDVGGVPRQIVSGIAEAYEPEQLVGRTIIVIANLKPAKLMGVESHGMLLAATVDGKAVLAGFDKDVPSGTRVK